MKDKLPRRTLKINFNARLALAFFLNCQGEKCYAFTNVCRHFSQSPVWQCSNDTQLSQTCTPGAIVNQCPFYLL